MEIYWWNLKKSLEQNNLNNVFETTTGKWI